MSEERKVNVAAVPVVHPPLCRPTLGRRSSGRPRPSPGRGSSTWRTGGTASPRRQRPNSDRCENTVDWMSGGGDNERGRVRRGGTFSRGDLEKLRLLRQGRRLRRRYWQKEGPPRSPLLSSPLPLPLVLFLSTSLPTVSALHGINPISKRRRGLGKLSFRAGSARGHSTSSIVIVRSFVC